MIFIKIFELQRKKLKGQISFARFVYRKSESLFVPLRLKSVKTIVQRALPEGKD